MPEVFTTPGDMRDGCGSYGRHITGASPFQAYYKLSNVSVAVAGQLLAANVDNFAPVPPPSEDKIISTLRCYVLVGGTTSFLRMAIYDAELWPALSLVVDAGEAASDTSTAILEVALGANVTLRRNRRYLSVMCARGAVLPTVWRTADSDYTYPSWLGCQSVRPGVSIGRLQYSRVNAAFPATYNGVYAAQDGKGHFMDALLP
jgi:hypothetical protein